MINQPIHHRHPWLSACLTLLLILAQAFSLVPAYAHAEPHADQAIIHYHRPAGDYDGWGLHLWGDTSDSVTWEDPLPFTGEDDFGIYWTVNLKPDAKTIGFIIHKGEEKDPGPDMTLDLTVSRQAWIVTANPVVFTEKVDPAEVPTSLPPAEEPAPPLTSVSFPGNYASQLGGAEWEPADPLVQASDEDGDGIWTLTVTLPAGNYEFKVAINGSWDLNYGLNSEQNGPNIPFETPEGGADVTFAFNSATRAITIEQSEPSEGTTPPAAPNDNQIAKNALWHDSRSDRYRSPFGAVTSGSNVTLRLRSAANDVASVNLLVDNLEAANSFARPMSKAASHDGYDYWETTLNVGDALTVWNYQFQVTDGSTTVYIADNGLLDGGEGRVYTIAPQNGQGWDIYVYHPDFTAPEWAQNAVIYQIFPDRFRNGEPANDPTEDDWFYPNERAHAFPVQPWNRPVPDPIPLDPNPNPDWYGTFSSTFYGGDLQGVLEKLDYLQELGVTTIYFNPIFESPSNHKYDGSDYSQVDDNLAILGDPAASNDYFAEFAAEVHKRGMHLILDGVPNHLSSDSPFFDRFKRHATEGACESEQSPYRDWFFFNQVAGGVCAGDSNYSAWAGYDTLPQLDNTNQEVIDNWLGDEGIIQQWLTTPGVDGFRIDVVPDVVGVNPRYFEEFRTVAKENHPDALLISETWNEPDARLRVLGDEFDSSMNYRFRRAVLGFLRDTNFEDNDPMIPAFSPSEFDAALRAIQEDYPPAAFLSAMNLIDSHDVNRAVHVLDHDGIDYTKNPPQPRNNFEDGRNRLRLAALLQFTLPGAPTIYYGDEVGLTGFGSDAPRDDPYNRQPYPWPDAEGYDDLPTWRQQDTDLLAYYQTLGQLRGQHAFLRTGSWDTLLINDDAGLYIYGRKDASGAAIILINRSQEVQTVALDTSGYLPNSARLSDPFSEATRTLNADEILEYHVQPLSFQLWLTGDDTDMSTPDVASFYGTEGDSSVALTLESGGETAVAYHVYRSLLAGGFERIGAIERAGDTTEFTDEGLTNGLTYHYYVRAVNEAGLEGEASEPLIFIPHVAVEEVQMQDPLAIQHTISALTPTMPILGSVFVPGISEGDGAGVGIQMQLGYAPAGSSSFTWVDGIYESETQGGSDIYAATLLPDALGEYTYQWRASTTNGRDWVMSDNEGTLTVIASEDTEAPNAPFKLNERKRSSSELIFDWSLRRTPDLVGYRICRTDVTPEVELGDTGVCPVRIHLPKQTTILTDSAVIAGHAYSYTVSSYDSSFNFSPPSKALVLTATLAIVDVTWRVLVPAGTPPTDQIYIAGDKGDVFGASFNPSLMAMTAAGENVWEWTAKVKEGTALQYKYTRGSWETVESWGAIRGFGNRTVEVVNQGGEKMLVEDTATDWGAEGPDDHRAIQSWRDPLVVATGPVADAVGAVEVITATFSLEVKAGDLATVIVVEDADGQPVAGEVTADGLRSFIFTPADALAPGEYRVTVGNVEGEVKMANPYQWSFTVADL